MGASKVGRWHQVAEKANGEEGGMAPVGKEMVGEADLDSGRRCTIRT